MKPSEVFGIFIRCVGLVLALFGLHELFRTVIMLLQNISVFSLSPLMLGIPTLVLGVWLLRGAPWLVFFSYPQGQMKKE